MLRFLHFRLLLQRMLLAKNADPKKQRVSDHDLTCLPAALGSVWRGQREELLARRAVALADEELPPRERLPGLDLKKQR